MGAPLAAFLTLLISLLLFRRFVFRPAAPAVPQGLLDGASIAALNRDRRQQLQQRRVETPVEPELLPLPSSTLQARELLLQLKALSQGDRAARLLAMRTATAWGDRRCLPLLRMGLRDPAAAVALSASLGLEAFRGEPLGGYRAATGNASLPRNVARMR
ncbi:MAG: hypothetical protein VKJ87_03990 [Synechococcus sp.]|nr:hypothetical protein [Synechococcus sp.]